MYIRSSVILAGAVSVAILGVSGARASISPLTGGSEAQAYFGSQGTAFKASDPTVLFTAASPIGPYTPLAGIPLPNVPAPSSTTVYPTPLTPNAFAGGSGYTFNFNDGFSGTAFYTAATTTIDHAFFQGGTSTADAQITFPTWSFGQGPSAPSYAYEQVNFVSQYMVTTFLTASTPAFTMFVMGSNSGAGTPFAQFDERVTYDWIPTNSALVPTGLPTTLGTLDYSWQTSGSGPFSGTMTSAGSLIATPTAFGVLELRGYAYVTGDPFQMTISSSPLPEPMTLGMLGVGAAALVLRRRRRA